MAFQKSAYKTLSVLIAMTFFSIIGFTSAVRGYGSNDSTPSPHKILGVSVGTNDISYVILWILVILVLGGILFAIYRFIIRKPIK